MSESADVFEKRKQDHIEKALIDANEARGLSGLEQIQLIHEALPEIDLSDVTLETVVLGQSTSTPFLVSSMTAGHAGANTINISLAKVAQERGWIMGVGSQRRELYDSTAAGEWKALRANAPRLRLFGNLGLAQLIETPLHQIQRLVDSLEANGMIIHLNPLQECLQKEGTPRFRNGMGAIAQLVRGLSVPVIVKETGCGLSEKTLRRLNETGIAAVDVAGLGGTHWGRIEGARQNSYDTKFAASQTFANWGISTLESIEAAVRVQGRFEIWASGGIRSGLDAARVIALGADVVGWAKPALEAVIDGEDALHRWMEQMEFELKVALFCTGSKHIKELREGQRWKKISAN